MTKDLKYRILKWVKDFKSTQPGNVDIDEDTFEGSAYFIFKNVLRIFASKEAKENQLKALLEILLDWAHETVKEDSPTIKHIEKEFLKLNRNI